MGFNNLGVYLGFESIFVKKRFKTSKVQIFDL